MSQAVEIISSKPTQSVERSWTQAYIHFLRDRHESRTLKIMPLVILGIVPISIVDDFLLPVLGIADDLPTFLLVIVVAALTLIKVNGHRQKA